MSSNSNSNNSKKNKIKIDPVEVFCRIRPLSENENNEKCLKVLDENNLMLQVPECSAAYRSGPSKQLIYSFTKIFEEVIDQNRIFEEVGVPLVQDLLIGKNGLLFTYGVTGSGKTYTMMGDQQDPGLLQRSLDTIFNSITFQQAKRCIFKPDKMNSFDIQNEGEALIERHRRDLSSKATTASSISTQRSRAQTDTEKLVDSTSKILNIIENNVYAVFISCVEIYNNYIYDLLDDSNLDPLKRGGDNKESKCLKEDSKGFMYIKDMAEIEVKSTEEAIELMHRAQKRRVVAYTDLNSESSRSHSIFTVRVVQAPFDSTINDFNPKSKSAIHVSQLSMVDLAGSERTKRTKNTGNRLKEAGNINSSLMALRNCIETLRENLLIPTTRKMVPYRDSKLTLLFKNYFEGNGKIKMILCINPSAQEFDETINVLKFSEIIKDVLITLNNNSNENNKMNGKTIPFDIGLTSSLFNNIQQNSFSFNNNCPSIHVDSCDDDASLYKLIEFLEEFSNKRQTLVQETNAVNQQLYCKIRELYEENDKLKDENFQLKFQLDLKTKKENMLENKVKALEKIVCTPIKTLTQKENLRPITLPTPTTTTDSEFHTIEKKRNNRETETTTTTTLQQTPIFSNRTNTKITNTIGKLGSHHNIALLASAGQQQQQPPLQKPISSIHMTSTTNTQMFSNRYQQSPMRVYHPPPIPHSNLREGVPVANKRGQRRSKSAEHWLDHKPSTTTKTDTVLQPKMHRKKSVSKLELADAKKSSKYVLTHQQQDTDGELVTNLIRGDVIRSPCGGANIIFTDVETLRVKTQEHPKNFPKCSNDMFVDDPLIIEERCSMAIEGHNSSIRKTIK